MVVALRLSLIFSVAAGVLLPAGIVGVVDLLDVPAALLSLSRCCHMIH